MFYWRAVQQLDHRPHEAVGKAERDTTRLESKRKGDYQRQVANAKLSGRESGWAALSKCLVELRMGGA
jgi:hypothetical protein